MDHILVLNGASPIIANGDWYGLHAKLYDHMGPRVDADGNPRWHFSIDPRITAPADKHPERFVVVRSVTDDASAAASEVARVLGPIVSAGRGDVVRFHATVSGRAHRTKAKNMPPSMVADRNIRAAIAKAGLSLNEGSLEIADTVRLASGKRKIFVPALRVTGIAKVSDAEALNAALRAGVGRDRAFGVGILIVEPMEFN